MNLASALSTYALRDLFVRLIVIEFNNNPIENDR